jgi:hypothetical protein
MLFISICSGNILAVSGASIRPPCAFFAGRIRRCAGSGSLAHRRIGSAFRWVLNGSEELLTQSSKTSRMGCHVLQMMVKLKGRQLVQKLI